MASFNTNAGISITLRRSAMLFRGSSDEAMDDDVEKMSRKTREIAFQNVGAPKLMGVLLVSSTLALVLFFTGARLLYRFK